MLAGFMSVTPPAHAGSTQDVRAAGVQARYARRHTLADAPASARANGFDVVRLRMTPQTPPSREARNAIPE